MSHNIPDSELFYIHPQLRALAVPVDSIQPDPRNARRHDAQNKAQVRALLEDYGQLLPIVVNAQTGIIEKGNCTYEQTKALGRKYIAAVNAAHGATEATSFALRDNRVGELGDWEYQTVAELLNELEAAEAPIDNLGWSESEVENLLAAEWQPPAIKQDVALNAAPESSPGNAAPGEGLPPSLPPGSDASRVKPIAVTPDQWEVIEQAIERVKLLNDDQAMTPGRCLELVCGDYLAGN